MLWPTNQMEREFISRGKRVALFLKIERVASNRNSRCSGQTEMNRPVSRPSGENGAPIVRRRQRRDKALRESRTPQREKNSISFEQFYFDWRWACPLGQHKIPSRFGVKVIEFDNFSLKFYSIDFLKFLKEFSSIFFNFFKMIWLMQSFRVHLHIQMTLEIN